MITLILRLLVVALGVFFAIFILYVKDTYRGLTLDFNSDTPILHATLVLVITVITYLVVIGVVGLLSLSYEHYDIEKVGIGNQVESVLDSDITDVCYYLEIENDYIIHYDRNYIRNLKKTSTPKKMYVFGSKNYKNLSDAERISLEKLDIGTFKVALVNMEVKGDRKNEIVDAENVDVKEEVVSNKDNVHYSTVDKILELEEIIDDQDIKLYELSEAVKKKDEEMSKLNDEIKKKDEEISRLDRLVKEKEGLLIKKDEQINKLHKLKEINIKYVILGFVSIWIMILVTINMIVRLRLKVKKELILTASDAKIREGVMLEEDKK